MKTNLLLKGSRQYLHSTDFYHWFSEEVCTGDEWLSKLVFKKVIRNQCDIYWEQPKLEISGFFELSNGTSKNVRKGWLVETSELAQKNYDYDEDSLVERAVIDNDRQTITLNNQQNASTIEVVVALTKKLHNELFPVKNGKWLVGQLEFVEDLPIDYLSLSITVNRIIKSKFSVSTIVVNGRNTGSIRFIVGDPDDRH